MNAPAPAAARIARGARSRLGLESLALVVLPVALIATAVACGAPAPVLMLAVGGVVGALVAVPLARAAIAAACRHVGIDGAWLALGLLSILAGEVSAISFGGQSGRILWADAVFGAGTAVLLVARRFALDIPRAPFLAALLPVLAWSALGIPFSQDPLTAIAELKEWIVAAVVAACIVRWVRDARRARVMLGAVTLVTAAIAAMMTAVALRDPRGFAIAVLTKTVDLSWGRSNYLAGMLGLGLSIGLGLLGSARRGWERALWLGALAAIAYGLAISASKGAILATVLATAAVFLGPYARRSRRLPQIVLLSVVGLVAALFIAGPLRVALEYRLQVSALDYSGTERLALYQIAIEQGLRHPLLGIGINNFSVASHGLHGLDTVPHNLELGYFAELGVPGLAFVLAWCATLLVTAYRAVRAATTPDDRTLALGVLAGVAGALLHNQVESTLYGEQFKLLFLAVAAASWRLGCSDDCG